jgi:antitoxin CcdA
MARLRIIESTDQWIELKGTLSDVCQKKCQKDTHFVVSQVCDTYLREVVRREQERRWREERADFVAAYNATIETEGLPLEEWRGF